MKMKANNLLSLCLMAITCLVADPLFGATPLEAVRRHATMLGDRVPSHFLRDTLKSQALGRAVDYGVLLPDGYAASQPPYPLVVFLHGAAGDREYLELRRPGLESLWRSGEVPRFVVATLSAELSFYMDARNGQQQWETFILNEWLPHLRTSFNLSADRKDTVVTGTSMGGFGSLMLAFRNTGTFGAVAAMEPMTWPALSFADLENYQIIMQPERLAALFGLPGDEDWWRSHNPASIVAAKPGHLRDAGIAIYIECGDQDAFGFHEGTEFLHRVLWDNRITHQYRLVRSADHVGRSLEARSLDRFRFIGNFLAAPVPEPALDAFRETRARAVRQSGFEPFPYWPDEPRSLVEQGGSRELDK